ncbi:MAG TPA: hypothetical protein VK422_15015 [Pyrinomonadaceae bacterium]|nr:hypothetical protein [Pyrinomonadaceae bacterium]
MTKLKRAGLGLPSALLLLSALQGAATPPARAQNGAATPEQPAAEAPASPGVAYGSLQEVVGRMNARLLVIRPRTVSAGDPALGVAEAVRKRDVTERRLGRLHNAIAVMLNKYVQKYGSMTAARSPEQADYVVVFNLLQFKRTLNGIYPTGEMYLVAYREPGPPRVLWQTPKEMFYDDATKSLIKALKQSRGEK